MQDRLARLLWENSRLVKTALDLGAWTVASVLAIWLRAGGPGLVWTPAEVVFMAWAAPVVLVVTLAARLPRHSWAHVGIRDLQRLAGATVVTTLTLFFLVSLLQYLDGPAIARRVPLIAGVLAFVGQGGTRVLVRILHENRRLGRPPPTTGRRALIIGAGHIGTALVRELRKARNPDIEVVGFLDDSPVKQGMFFEGIPVLGTLSDLGAVRTSAGATHLFLAQPGMPDARRQAILHEADAQGLTMRTVPGLEDLLVMESPQQIEAVLRSFTSRSRASNVLVIGGAGYIGSALVPMLLEEGLHVRVLDSMIYGSDALAPVLDHERLEVQEGDFRNVDAVVAAMHGMDTVVHLGAIVGDPACQLDEGLTVETNLMATKMIAQTAKGFGISRFIFASTCSAYGVSDDLLDEESRLNPVSLYAKTKVASEKVLLSMASQEFNPVILRFATVYGFSGRTRFDLVVNLLTAKAFQGQDITLFGGSQWRPFIHVMDLARAVLATVRAPLSRLQHRVYNVGSDEQNMTLAQVAQQIKHHVPQADIVDHGPAGDLRNYRVRFRRFALDTGFQAHYTLDDGIEQVLDALRSGAVVDAAAPEHSNVHFLTEGGLSKIDRRVYSGIVDSLHEEGPRPPTAAKTS